MDRTIISHAKIYACCVFVFCSFYLQAQYCQNYGSNCDLKSNVYAKGSSSQGLKISNGQRASVISTFFEGNENYISVCGEFDVGLVQFKILNAETKEVLYDNTDDYSKQNISIRVEVTTKVIIQLSIPDAKFSFNEGKCIGLLVAYKTFNH